MPGVVDRFIRYIKIDTQSDRNSDTHPSTAKQFDLAHLLVGELTELGLKDVSVDENCYVMATLPSNLDHPAPTIGWIAHMDTSPDMAGAHVNPQFVENYDGKDIVLNAEKQILLSPVYFPDLKKYIGKTLITTDGTTLLGADDKAGIAEIMTALAEMVAHPEIKHGTIKIGFTPDEEIGRGADLFDVKKFNADFAYTLDGGEIGELQYENFNAAQAEVLFHGRGVHPGSAKDKMINAILVAMEFNAMLPVEQRPEYTANYEGFYHPFELKGDVESARMVYIIRDHDRRKFEAKKDLLEKAAGYLNQKYGMNTVELRLKDQYYNMKELIEPVKYIIDIADQAMKDLGIQPLIIPIRGGTDGATLSYMGLPTPNIFTGGHNAHGKYEYVPVESLEKATQVILKITQMVAQR